MRCGTYVLAALISSQPLLAQFSQQGAKLVGCCFSRQGQSVAISADGSTVAVGALGGGGGVGGVLIYTRSGGVFSQQGSALVGTGAVGNSAQGSAVALSGDGNTLLVGGVNDNSFAGAAWVFTRSGGVWTQLGDKLVGTGAVGTAQQGWSVALSSDGNTALVGGPGDTDGIGAAWVYNRTPDGFSQQAKLVSAAAIGTYPNQGLSVALSADGNTALVGAPGEGTDQAGAGHVFTRSGGTWTEEGTLAATPGAAYLLAHSTALSADGSTALLGTMYGGVWLFRRTSGVWGLVTQYPLQNAGLFTTAVALSGDASTLAAGLPGVSGSVGSVWVSRDGPQWPQTLVGSGGQLGPRQGSSVALSSDGRTLVTGGPSDYDLLGAAWVFTELAFATVSGGGGPFCAGRASVNIRADLGGAPPWTVSWSDGLVQDGVAASPLTRSVSPAATTTYTVAVSNALGTGDSLGSATATVNPTPATPTAGNSGPICAGGVLALSTPAVSGAAYAWTGPDGFTSFSRTPAIAGVSTAASGTYSVTVTVGACASDPGTTTAVVNPDAAPPAVTPPASITVDQSECCGVFGGATPSGSGPLAIFLAFGGSAVDDCDPDPLRLDAQIGGVDVGASTCLEAGATTVTFRYEDSSGKLGTAASNCTVRMYGDLNLDAVVDPSDMVVMRAYFNFVATPGTPPFRAPLSSADLTHEGTVDPSDMVVLRAFFNFVVSCLAP